MMTHRRRAENKQFSEWGNGSTESLVIDGEEFNISNLLISTDHQEGLDFDSDREDDDQPNASAKTPPQNDATRPRVGRKSSLEKVAPYPTKQVELLSGIDDDNLQFLKEQNQKPMVTAPERDYHYYQQQQKQQQQQQQDEFQHSFRSVSSLSTCMTDRRQPPLRDYSESRRHAPLVTTPSSAYPSSRSPRSSRNKKLKPPPEQFKGKTTQEVMDRVARQRQQLQQRAIEKAAYAQAQQAKKNKSSSGDSVCSASKRASTFVAGLPNLEGLEIEPLSPSNQATEKPNSLRSLQSDCKMPAMCFEETEEELTPEKETKPPEAPKSAPLFGKMIDRALASRARRENEKRGSRHRKSEARKSLELSNSGHSVSSFCSDYSTSSRRRGGCGGDDHADGSKMRSGRKVAPAAAAPSSGNLQCRRILSTNNINPPSTTATAAVARPSIRRYADLSPTVPVRTVSQHSLPGSNHGVDSLLANSSHSIDLEALDEEPYQDGNIAGLDRNSNRGSRDNLLDRGSTHRNRRGSRENLLDRGSNHRGSRENLLDRGSNHRGSRENLLDRGSNHRSAGNRQRNLLTKMSDHQRRTDPDITAPSKTSSPAQPVPSKKSSSGSPRTNHKPRSGTTSIEVAPGVFEVLRGTKESVRAAHYGFLKKVNCMCCTYEFHCINNVKFVICPTCRVVSPVNLDEEDCYGVGLGFAMEDLEPSPAPPGRRVYNNSSSSSIGSFSSAGPSRRRDDLVITLGS